jgi:hypothetical protein
MAPPPSRAPRASTTTAPASTFAPPAIRRATGRPAATRALPVLILLGSPIALYISTLMPNPFEFESRHGGRPWRAQLHALRDTRSCRSGRLRRRAGALGLQAQVSLWLTTRGSRFGSRFGSPLDPLMPHFGCRRTVCPDEAPMIVQVSGSIENHRCKACQACLHNEVSVVQVGYNATNACAGYSIFGSPFCPLRRAC